MNIPTKAGDYKIAFKNGNYADIHIGQRTVRASVMDQVNGNKVSNGWTNKLLCSATLYDRNGKIIDQVYNTSPTSYEQRMNKWIAQSEGSNVASPDEIAIMVKNAFSDRNIFYKDCKVNGIVRGKYKFTFTISTWKTTPEDIIAAMDSIGAECKISGKTTIVRGDACFKCTVYVPVDNNNISETITKRVIKITERDLYGMVRNALNEVRYINPGRSESYNGKVKKGYNYYKTRKEDPIKNGDKIRVFHGCQLKTALDWCINGTSGRDWHPRTYSYEAGMNPLGIFVTIDFETAKRFGSDYECMCIIEFTADASDLETPVWNNSDSYFGQGSNPMPFRTKEDRELQKQKYRDDAINKPDLYYDRNTTISRDYIRNSDKPEMADRLMNMGEYQALFMGNLDPNQIKRIWINPKDEESGYVLTTNSYIPLTRAEFLKRYRQTPFYKDQYAKTPKPLKKNRLYRPNEDFIGWDDFFDRLDVGQERRDELLNDIMRLDNYKEYVSSEMFPKQIIQAFGQEYFNKKFNRFGQ